MLTQILQEASSIYETQLISGISGLGPHNIITSDQWYCTAAVKPFSVFITNLMCHIHMDRNELVEQMYAVSIYWVNVKYMCMRQLLEISSS